MQPDPSPHGRRHPMPITGADPGVQLVGTSAPHLAMLDQLERITASEAPALIEGETGTGKELAARAIHYGGARCSGPFVPVNCGALPDSLLESELFGVERGAFTDARQARRGLVAEARGGTLFLDEVDSLSPKAQVTLLRFIQDQCYRPVGTAREQRTDVRLLAAANRGLAGLVAEHAFRSDLLYRLNVLYLELPPLRERGDDVELLARHFIACYAAKYRKPEKTLHPSTLQWLHRYPWSGNVRELENWVHREFLMAPGMQIVHGRDAAAAPCRAPEPVRCYQQAKAEAVSLFERDYLQRALEQAGGNVTRAAQLAGKERRAFGKLLKKHGLVRSSTAS